MNKLLFFVGGSALLTIVIIIGNMINLIPDRNLLKIGVAGIVLIIVIMFIYPSRKKFNRKNYDL